MAIDFDCKCGEPLRVDDKYANTGVQCPGCRKMVGVPASSFLPAEDPPPDPEPKPSRPFRNRDADYIKRPESGSPESKAMNSGMVGGLIAMAIAVVWFVGAFALGFVFFYPPILFVMGLIGFFRGLANRE